MYLTYQKKGETGKVYTKDEMAIDEPSLGPGSVDDSAVTPVMKEAPAVTVVLGISRNPIHLPHLDAQAVHPKLPVWMTVMMRTLVLKMIPKRTAVQ